MGDSTKIDLDGMENVATSFEKIATIFENVKGKISNVEIATDTCLQTIDTSGLQNLLVNLQNTSSKLKDEVTKIHDNFERAEKANRDLEIGDWLYLGEGINYYESASGAGRSGTIGSDIRGKGNYAIDRIAFYVDGKMIENTDETGTNIDEARMKYAKEYNVDPSKINISMHITTKDGNDTGWVDQNQISFDKENKTVNYKDIELKTGNDIKKYESKNIKLASAEEFATKYIDIKENVLEDEKYSALASLGHGATNVAIGMVDSLTCKFVSTESWQKGIDKFFRKKGSYLTEKDKKIQHFVGEAAETALEIVGTAGVATAVKGGVKIAGKKVAKTTIGKTGKKVAEKIGKSVVGKTGKKIGKVVIAGKKVATEKITKIAGKALTSGTKIAGKALTSGANRVGKVANSIGKRLTKSGQEKVIAGMNKTARSQIKIKSGKTIVDKATGKLAGTAGNVKTATGKVMTNVGGKLTKAAEKIEKDAVFIPSGLANKFRK